MSVLVVIQLDDLKGDFWELVFVNKVRVYTNAKGEGPIAEVWVHAPERPDALWGYEMIPLPVFTEWWD